MRHRRDNIKDTNETGIYNAWYSFIFWNTQPDGSGETYMPGGTLTITNNVTLYAQWTPELFTVTFDANGGAPIPSPQSVLYGNKVTRPVDPVRSEYVLYGWYPTPDFSGSTWNFNTGTVTSNMTLYARWIQPT